jgi:hypothetical protein
MKRTALCISDALADIQAAVRKEWLGASRQQCKVVQRRDNLRADRRIDLRVEEAAMGREGSWITGDVSSFCFIRGMERREGWHRRGFRAPTRTLS